MKKTYEKGKISVIIPCFNQGEYIDEAVDSILNQTYQNFEIIIINDGSTDKFTNDLLKDYTKPKTKVYTTKNQGLASARNYGYLLSKGEFIQFLDADDFLDPLKFEKQIKEFEKDNSLGISYTNYKCYYEETNILSEPKMQDLLGDNAYEDFLYKWQRGLSIPIHCALFKRNVFGESEPFISGFKAIEDWIMWITIAKGKNKFKYLNKEYAIYRIHPENMTKNKDFMIYWVARAISYIADYLVDQKDLDKFNIEQEKYLRNLINSFYLSPLNIRINEEEEKIRKMENIKEELERTVEEKDKRIRLMGNTVKQMEEQLNLIRNSESYKIGRILTFIPSYIKGLIKKNNK